MRLVPKARHKKYLLSAVGLLAAVLVIVITILPRVHESFGYHPEQNAREWEDKAVSYVGASTCKDCHAEVYAEWRASPHGTVNCEDCHGAAAAHIQEGGALSITQPNKLCELCHAEIPGRPSEFAQVNPDKHAGQSSCLQCHNPHDPRAGLPPQVPHTLEGRSDCLVCHNPGGIKPFPDNHVGRTSDTCLNCHGRGLGQE